MDSVGGMRMFTRVVDAGSFSEAARQLGVAPSSVSRQINDLESHLNARLFNRTTRQLSLTEAGQIYYERAARIIMEVDEARLALSELGSPTGILRITSPAGIGREVVASILPEFLERYPGIRVVMSMTDYLVDLVAGNVDVGIRVGQLEDSSLKARKIGESRRVLCASPDYIKREGAPRKPTDLQDHNCITFREHPGHNVWKFRGPKGLEEVRVTGNLFARNVDAMVSAASAGLGLVYMPDWNLRTRLKRKELKVVMSRYESVPRRSQIWAVHTHQRHVPPKIRVFIDYLIERFEKTGPRF